MAGASNATMTAIRVDGLRKRYGTLDALRGITFDVGDGEIFGLIGPDGAGKTSAFQILAGVMEPTDGVAEIFGRPAREARSQTGYLTQAFSLYPDLSVGENLRYAGDLRRVLPADHRCAQRDRFAAGIGDVVMKGTVAHPVDGDRDLLRSGSAHWVTSTTGSLLFCAACTLVAVLGELWTTASR